MLSALACLVNIGMSDCPQSRRLLLRSWDGLCRFSHAVAHAGSGCWSSELKAVGGQVRLIGQLKFGTALLRQPTASKRTSTELPSAGAKSVWWGCETNLRGKSRRRYQPFVGIYAEETRHLAEIAHALVTLRPFL